jgi:ABC-type Mn2+/Zn2+ transport system ATPase subunit
VSTHTLPIRVRDVVTMGRYATLGLFRRIGAADRAAVTRSMERTGVTDIAERSIRNLSGGQQQRAHLAQVLAREANVLLLDEPTAGLDINGRREVGRIIAEERARGVTVVMATHELSDAEDATAVMLLAQRVVAVGPPAEALRDDALRECFGFTQPH